MNILHKQFLLLYLFCTSCLSKKQGRFVSRTGDVSRIKRATLHLIFLYLRVKAGKIYMHTEM